MRRTVDVMPVARRDKYIVATVNLLLKAASRTYQDVLKNAIILGLQQMDRLKAGDDDPDAWQAVDEWVEHWHDWLNNPGNHDCCVCKGTGQLPREHRLPRK